MIWRSFFLEAFAKSFIQLLGPRGLPGRHQGFRLGPPDTQTYSSGGAKMNYSAGPRSWGQRAEGILRKNPGVFTWILQHVLKSEGFGVRSHLLLSY